MIWRTKGITAKQRDPRLPLRPMHRQSHSGRSYMKAAGQTSDAKAARRSIAARRRYAQASRRIFRAIRLDFKELLRYLAVPVGSARGGS
jgi:hypothetical protein